MTRILAHNWTRNYPEHTPGLNDPAVQTSDLHLPPGDYVIECSVPVLVERSTDEGLTWLPLAERFTSTDAENLYRITYPQGGKAATTLYLEKE